MKGRHRVLRARKLPSEDHFLQPPFSLELSRFYLKDRTTHIERVRETDCMYLHARTHHGRNIGITYFEVLAAVVATVVLL